MSQAWGFSAAMYLCVTSVGILATLHSCHECGESQQPCIPMAGLGNWRAFSHQLCTHVSGAQGVSATRHLCVLWGSQQLRTHVSQVWGVSAAMYPHVISVGGLGNHTTMWREHGGLGSHAPVCHEPWGWSQQP